MFLRRIIDNQNIPAVIAPVVASDYKTITKKKFSFNWNLEKERTVYKLTAKGDSTILGLMSVTIVTTDQLVEIRLLAVAMEQIGKEKKIDRIAGNLIAFAARLAVKEFGANAAITLIPKTALRQHYINRYGFEPAGRILFAEGAKLFELLKSFDHD